MIATRLYETGLRQVTSALASLHSSTPQGIGHWANDMHRIATIAAETGNGEISTVAQDAEVGVHSLAAAQLSPEDKTPPPSLANAETKAKSICIDALGRLGQMLLSEMCDEAHRFALKESPHKISIRVLIVDDSTTASVALCNAFSAQEFAVRSASTLEDAFIELLLFEPHVLVSDVFMPELEVELLCRAFRSLSHSRASFLILISAATGQELKLKLEGVKPDAFVPKIAGVTEVVATVSAMTRESGKLPLD